MTRNVADFHMRLPAKVSAIVFDVDGTLYDQHALRLMMLRRLFSECLENPVAGFRSIRFLRAYRAAHESLRGENAPLDLGTRQLEIACRSTGMQPWQAGDIVKRLFETAPLAYLHRLVRVGVTEFLQAARARGIRLGIYSDYPAEAKLQAMSLAGYFDVVVSSRDTDVGRLKPHPVGLQRCLARLDVEGENALYLGDRVIDAECARRANVCPVIVGSRKRSDSCITMPGFEKLHALLF
jgi:phosphoglycolate phosphatase-like HAD superfamily hydrolase